MGMTVRKSINFVPGKKLQVLGSGTGMRVNRATPQEGGGGGGPCGTQINPCELLTDGTPLTFTLDAGIPATLRSAWWGETAYGHYSRFTAPTLGVSQYLRIKYGVQNNGVDNLNTYMYLFDGADWTGTEDYVQLSERLIAEDNDGGPGNSTTFDDTRIQINTLTPGETYYIEATAYYPSEGGNVKIIAEVITVEQVTYDLGEFGLTVLNPGDYVFWNTNPDPLIIVANVNSSYANKSYTISTSDAGWNAVTPVATGTAPLNLLTTNLSPYYGSTYTVNYGGGVFDYYFVLTVSGINYKLLISQYP